MGERPYILLSCGMSIDGYLDGATDERLLLSNDADFDRVDARPRRLRRDPRRRRDRPARQPAAAGARRRPAGTERVARGLRPSPVKVTVTATGQLDADAEFFTTGDVDKLVYCASAAVDEARGAARRRGDRGRRRPAGRPAVDDRGPATRAGCGRLMVEGGGTMHTQFLTADLADELHLVVAPFFVGDSRARRFVGDGRFPWNPDRRATLAEVRQIGDVVLLRYALSRPVRHRPT